MNSIIAKFGKAYYYNIINAIFIFFVSIYIRYFWGPVVEEMIKTYKYNPQTFNIFLYLNYLKVITVIMVIGFIFFILSIVFSNVLWKIKGINRFFPYSFLVLCGVLPIAQIYHYFFIKNSAFNYKEFHIISIYTSYYQYVILNAIMLIITSAFSFNIFEINNKSKKFYCFITSIFFILALSFDKIFIFYYGSLPVFFTIFLSLSNIFLALVEYKEDKNKLSNENK